MVEHAKTKNAVSINTFPKMLRFPSVFTYIVLLLKRVQHRSGFIYRIVSLQGFIGLNLESEFQKGNILRLSSVKNKSKTVQVTHRRNI